MKQQGIVIFVLGCLALACHAEEASKPLLSAADSEKRLTPSSPQVSVAKSSAALPGFEVTIQPGKDAWPGITITPDGNEKTWDLGAFGHVTANLVNTGQKPITLALRIDNDGDWKNNPFNSESASVKPGESAAIKVVFGHSYGFKPAFKLNSKAVTRALIFAGTSTEAQSFRVVSIEAGGAAGEGPPAAPQAVRVKPKDGVMFKAGQTAVVAPGAKAPPGAAPETVTTGLSDSDATVNYRLVSGAWDLRDDLQVRVTVRNKGAQALTLRGKVESGSSSTDWTVSAAPVAAGQTAELVLPFINPVVWHNGDKGTGNQINNDAVSGIGLSAKDAKPDAFEVQSIVAEAPAETLPDWLGKKPPVEGDWTMTFEDNFDGDKIDDTKWNIYGENYWDKLSHFSKENISVSGGFAHLTFSKKTGHQNDDPNHKRVTDYAAGFLDTYGKWVQRYGYFEARMKLPTAPGLWPAFWMMPDRGADTGPQWKRQSTSDGGMEFDILEYLTRWGSHRYNIAMHYDGYDKNHKATGSGNIYFQPDKDGFVTAGLLWTPGLAVYYANGKEVLRWENPRIGSVPEILMFTLPMGGWDNSPLDDAKLPDDFIVDWVRCWQRKDLASDADGAKGKK